MKALRSKPHSLSHDFSFLLIGTPHSGKTTFLSHWKPKLESFEYSVDPTHPLSVQHAQWIIDPSSSMTIQCYSTPLQPQFDFIWRSVVQSKDSFFLGAILLLDARRPTLLSDLESTLHYLTPSLQTSRILIALNHLDPALPLATQIQPLRDLLAQRQLPIPIIPVHLLFAADASYLLHLLLLRTSD